MSTAFEKQKLCHSLGRPSRSDFVHFEFREKLEVWEGKNATVLPMRRPAGEYGRGGVVDEQGNYVVQSEVGKAVNKGYEFTNAEYRDEKVVYCGFLINHWGHFLMEGVSRLWYFLENDESIDKYVFFLDENEERSIGGNFKEFLQLLNIYEKIEVINQPTTFRQVLVPEPAYRCSRYFSKQFLDIFNEVARNVDVKANWAKPDKIYLSRSKFSKGKLYEFGLDALDSFYENNGYMVVFPEKMSLSELIYYIRNTTIVASTSGTLPHHMLLGHEGHKLVILERCIMNNDYQVDVNRMMKLEVTYIDAHVPVYSVGMRGPFIMGYNDLVESYALNNSMNPPDKKYRTDKFWKRCFVKYMYSYKYQYGYQWFVPDWYLEFTEELWEGYQAGEKYYGEYLSGAKMLQLSQIFDWSIWTKKVKKLLKG